MTSKSERFSSAIGLQSNVELLNPSFSEVSDLINGWRLNIRAALPHVRRAVDPALSDDTRREAYNHVLWFIDRYKDVLTTAQRTAPERLVSSEDVTMLTSVCQRLFSDCNELIANMAYLSAVADKSVRPNSDDVFIYHQGGGNTVIAKASDFCAEVRG